MAAGVQIQHKRKAGAFVNGELSPGEMGLDTANSVWYFSTNGATVTNISSSAGSSAYSRVTGSNATTTGQSLLNITGLSAALLANSTYEFEAVLMVASSSTAGNGYGINFSAAGATIEAQISGTLAAATQKTLRFNALNTGQTPFVTVAANGGIVIKGIITTGANAGNLTVSHLKVTSGTSTVYINSFLRAVKIA